MTQCVGCYGLTNMATNFRTKIEGYFNVKERTMVQNVYTYFKDHSPDKKLSEIYKKQTTTKKPNKQKANKQKQKQKQKKTETKQNEKTKQKQNKTKQKNRRCCRNFYRAVERVKSEWVKYETLNERKKETGAI